MTSRSDSDAHADGCYSWGERHYECARRRIAALASELITMTTSRNEWLALAKEYSVESLNKTAVIGSLQCQVSDLESALRTVQTTSIEHAGKQNARIAALEAGLELTMNLDQQKRLAAHLIQHVADMDDRTSPDDQPEMMLVTGEELENALLCAFERYEAATPDFAAHSRADGMEGVSNE